MTAAGSQAPGTPEGLGRRLVGAAVGVVLPVLLVPLLAGLVLGGRPAALGALLGSLVAFLVALSAGWRAAAFTTPVAVAASVVAAVVQGGSLWALLLVLLGGLAGFASHRGLMAPAALTGMLASIVPGTASWQDTTVLALFLALGAVNGILAARRLGLPARQPGQELPVGRAVGVAVILAAVVGVAAWIAVRWDSPQSYWLPMTVFVIATPTTGVLVSHKAVSRLAGTAIAVLAVAATVPLGLPRPVVLLVATVLLLLSVVYAEPLWVNAALSAGAIVLLLTAGGADPGVVALDRLVAVGIGVVLLLVGIGTILLADGLRPRRRSAPLIEDYDPAGLRDA